MAHLNLAIVSLSVALLGPYAGSISGLARVTPSVCWTSRPARLCSAAHASADRWWDCAMNWGRSRKAILPIYFY